MGINLNNNYVFVITCSFFPSFQEEIDVRGLYYLCKAQDEG